MPNQSARKASKNQSTPEHFLSEFPQPIQHLSQQLRLLVKQTIPNVIERVYLGWRLIGYRIIEKRREVYFGFIFPKPEQVLLGFEYGILLSNPHHLLEGDGKQVRYVIVGRPGDIRPAEFAELIREAARIALMPKEIKTRLLLERDAILDAQTRGLIREGS